MEDKGFSFGIIVIGSGNIDKKGFGDTLNHEYGHIVQLRQVGLKSYITKVAVPSLIFATIAHFDKNIVEYYYDLPWERSADYFGDVERKYSFGSNEISSIYWCTVLAMAYFPQ